MRIRIPTRINRAIDTIEAHRRMSLLVGAAAVVAWPLAVWWASPTAAVITAVALALYVVGGIVATRFLAYRETIQDLRADLAAKDARIAALSEGDPLAPTAQYRSIGESGEVT